MADALDMLADEEGIDVRPMAPVSMLEKMFEHKGVARPAVEAAERKKIGMPRELYNLIGDRVPIAPSNGYSSEKARLGAKKPAQKWCWSPFTNPSRKLCHWVREGDKEKEYHFAKFDKGLQLMTFTDEEYTKHLTDDAWTLAETRLLFDLCQQFDLRFVVVHDRFMSAMVGTAVYVRVLTLQEPSATPRDVEAIKARYYSVVNRLAAARGLPENAVERTFVYDADHESRRKKQLEKLLNRTPGEVHEEEMLKQELKHFTQQKKDGHRGAAADRKKQLLQKGKPLIKPITIPAGPAPATPAAATAAAAPSTPAPNARLTLAESLATPTLLSSLPQTTVSPPLPEPHPEAASAPAAAPQQGAQLRSAIIHRPLHMQADLVERHLAQLGVAARPLPTEKVAALYHEIRENILALLNIERRTEAMSEELKRLTAQKSRPGESTKKRLADEDADTADRKSKR